MELQMNHDLYNVNMGENWVIFSFIYNLYCVIFRTWHQVVTYSQNLLSEKKTYL